MYYSPFDPILSKWLVSFFGMPNVDYNFMKIIYIHLELLLVILFLVIQSSKIVLLSINSYSTNFIVKILFFLTLDRNFLTLRNMLFFIKQKIVIKQTIRGRSFTNLYLVNLPAATTQTPIAKTMAVNIFIFVFTQYN